jgi:hypothetical protein
MKIKDLINNIDKKQVSSVYVGEMASLMGINDIWHYEECDITSYYLGDWLCTDTKVGWRVFFYKDVPVAISSQSARKSDENIEWVSKELYEEVRNYILSFQEFDEEIMLLDLEEEMGETYKIHFNGQLFKHHYKLAYYNGENVEILEELDRKNIIAQNLKIKTSNGEEIVNIRDLDFRFNLND